MIERLPTVEEITSAAPKKGPAGRVRSIEDVLRPYAEKLNEVIDAVNDHEDTLYGLDDDCGCDDDVLEGHDFCHCDEAPCDRQDCACDCHDSLDDETCSDCGGGLVAVDTKDGLFSDFAGFVAAHPDLRFYQALTDWSGYKKILGEDEGEDQYDLFYETTKGPKA